MEMEQQLKNKLYCFRKKYYENSFIIYELLRAMDKREVVLMGNLKDFSCIRGLRIGTEKFLKDIFRILDVYKKEYNIYISTARYSYIPPFSKKEERKKSLDKWFSEIHKYIIDYDIFLDFDYDESIKPFVFKNQVNRMFKILKKEKVPFLCHPSSDSGYQIILPSESFIDNKKFYSKLDKKKGFNDYAKSLVLSLKDNFHLKFLDTIGVGSLNKIKKCPYSICQNTILTPMNVFRKSSIFTKIDVNSLLNTLSFNKIIYYNNYANKETTQKNMNEFLNKYKLPKYKG